MFESHEVFNFCPSPLVQPHLLLSAAPGLASDFWLPEHTMVFHSSIASSTMLLLPKMCFILTFKIWLHVSPSLGSLSNGCLPSCQNRVSASLSVPILWHAHHPILQMCVQHSWTVRSGRVLFPSGPDQCLAHWDTHTTISFIGLFDLESCFSSVFSNIYIQMLSIWSFKAL